MEPPKQILVFDAYDNSNILIMADLNINDKYKIINKEKRKYSYLCTAINISSTGPDAGAELLFYANERLEKYLIHSTLPVIIQITKIELSLDKKCKLVSFNVLLNE